MTSPEPNVNFVLWHQSQVEQINARFNRFDNIPVYNNNFNQHESRQEFVYRNEGRMPPVPSTSSVSSSVRVEAALDRVMDKMNSQQLNVDTILSNFEDNIPELVEKYLLAQAVNQSLDKKPIITSLNQNRSDRS